MKKFTVAFVTAILIAGLFISPVAAQPPPPPGWHGGQGNQNYQNYQGYQGYQYYRKPISCTGNYVVQRGDYLALIARYCGVSVGSILANNRYICNPSLIYAGSVLNMTGTTNYTPPVYYNPQPPKPRPAVYYNRTSYYGNYYYPNGWFYGGYYNPYPTRTYINPRVTLSTYRADGGDSITVNVSGFPANANIDYRIAQQGESYTGVWDGKTDSNGNASKTITVPSSASKGQYWDVLVITTELVTGAAQAYSNSIYIDS